MEVSIKKEGWSGGGFRMVKVIAGNGEEPILKVSGKTLLVSIGPGLPNTMSKTIMSKDNYEVKTSFHYSYILQDHLFDWNQTTRHWRLLVAWSQS